MAREHDSENLEQTKKNLRNKTVLWAVTGMLIIAALATMAIAWYTRISNVHSVTFEVTDYELAVNDNTEDPFLVNIYTYSNLKKGDDDKVHTAAPGTSGYIPIKLSARHSDIDVDYSIILENLMLPELKEHIRFFYLVKGNKPVVLSMEGDTILEADKQYLITTGSSVNADGEYELVIPPGTQKKYIPAEKTATNAGDFTIKGTLSLETEKVIYIYWEWYEDAEAAKAAAASGNGFTDHSGKSETEWAAYCETWDTLDTDIGRYPAKYEEAMYLQLICTGAQSTPLLEQKNKQPIGKENAKTPATP